MYGIRRLNRDLLMTARVSLQSVQILLSTLKVTTHPHHGDNCGVARRKINIFINSGEMKVTGFQHTLDVNSNSCGCFMKLKGPVSGNGNQVYAAIHRFFTNRETAGIKRQKKKMKKEDEAKKFDISGVELPDEEDGEVEV